VNHNGSARGRQAKRLHGVGVKHPALVSVIRAAISTLISYTQTDYVVARCGDLQPALAGGQAVQSSAEADGRGSFGVKGIPDTHRGHGLQVCGRTAFVLRQCDYGKGAPAADQKAEPVGLTDLTEPSAPHSAGRKHARVGHATDAVVGIIRR